MKVSIKKAAQLLKDADNILILTHSSPDGDTLGSGFALYYALFELGKKVRVECNDEIPKDFRYLLNNYVEMDFTPDYIVAVDVASDKLLGIKFKDIKQNINLCIDHHPSNTRYAKNTVLDVTAAATVEIIYRVITALETPFNKDIANAIYTGITTDTGCFSHSNTTSKTHQIAAKMIGFGADSYKINKLMFSTFSKGRIKLEQLVISTLEYHFKDIVAIIYVNREMLEETGVKESEVEGISSIPKKIIGVKVGVTLRQKGNEDVYKISLRTEQGINASRICHKLGGGGHERAAGCTITGNLEHAKKTILKVIKEELEGSL